MVTVTNNNFRQQTCPKTTTIPWQVHVSFFFSLSIVLRSLVRKQLTAIKIKITFDFPLLAFTPSFCFLLLGISILCTIHSFLSFYTMQRLVFSSNSLQFTLFEPDFESVNLQLLDPLSFCHFFFAFTSVQVSITSQSFLFIPLSNEFLEATCGNIT